MFVPDSLMMSISGIRGLVGESMNPEIACRFTAAFAAGLGEGIVVVGRDPRASGACIAPVVFSTLRFFGLDVVDLGIVPTPTVGIMVGELRARGGIVITASHNGPEWNALKLHRDDGEFLTQPEMKRVIARATGEGPLFGPPGRFGVLRDDRTATDVHIRRILGLELIDPELIGGLGLTAAVDCVNGAGSVIIPELLHRLGIEVIELFTDTDAPFPHVPEPRPDSLAELSGAVRESGADIGFACDPDADRLVLVDDTGRVCSEEMTLALAADFVLKHERGPIAANISTSRLIDDVARAHGVAVHRSRVGEAHVIEMMKRTGAVIGGEGNGGVIYPRVHYGRDAMTGIALILQLMAEEGCSLRAISERLPDYAIVKRKVRFGGDLGGAASALREKFHGRVTDIDGIRIDMEGAWIQIRSSNTEPVVRIISEANKEEEALALAGEAEAILAAHSDGRRRT